MHRYTPAEINFLKKTIPGHSPVDVAILFNREFYPVILRASQVKCFMHNYGLCNYRDTRFHPGHASHNKGIKGSYYPGCEKGWFKSDHIPWNYQPVGTERINGDGYVDVKISDRKKQPWKRWKAKHIILWEAANRKVPKGHCVIFADGNKRNFALGNLLLVSRAELAVMNHSGLISAHKELTMAGKILANVKMAIAGRKRQLKRRKKCKAKKLPLP